MNTKETSVDIPPEPRAHQVSVLLPLPITPRRCIDPNSPRTGVSDGDGKTTTVGGGTTSARSFCLGPSPSGDAASSRNVSLGITSSTPRVSKSDFEVMNVIGHGQSGTVVNLVRSRIDGGLYAMKTVDKWSLIERQRAGDLKAIDRAARERNLHVELMTPNNPYFIQLYHTFQTSGHLYYILEYCPLDVFEYMRSFGPISGDQVSLFIAELSVAVDAIHRTGSIHRDIKIDNILISPEGHVRLSDFGSSNKFNESNQRCDSVDGFSVNIMPPEFFISDYGDYGTAIDWYQVGICAYQVLTGNNPFNGHALTSVDSPLYPPEWPVTVARDISGLILALLHPDETKRINSIGEIKSRLSSLPWTEIERGATDRFEAPFRPDGFMALRLPRMISTGDEGDTFDPVPLATFSFNANGL
jgi:serine/threonine protein kinase